jgi:hypothetical protein
MRVVEAGARARHACAAPQNGPSTHGGSHMPSTAGCSARQSNPWLKGSIGKAISRAAGWQENTPVGARRVAWKNSLGAQGGGGDPVPGARRQRRHSMHIDGRNAKGAARRTIKRGEKGQHLWARVSSHGTRDAECKGAGATIRALGSGHMEGGAHILAIRTTGAPHGFKFAGAALQQKRAPCCKRGRAAGNGASAQGRAGRGAYTDF